MVAIIDQNAKLIERVSYDAYGNARHHRAADLTGNGGVDGADQLALLGSWNGYGVGDLNRDGVVDGGDLLILQANWGNARVAGELSQTDNIIGYAGYIFNAEIPGAGLYTVRHRHYAPDLGRWLSRDPLGYVDGMSLYEYVRSASTRLIDSQGRFADDPSDQTGYPCAREANNWNDCMFCCNYYSNGQFTPERERCVSDCNRAFPPTKPDDPEPRLTPPAGRSFLQCLDPSLNQSDRGSCSKYGACDCLYGANVGCMCRCMGNDDPWSNYVRACLHCMLRVPGMNWHRAHSLCWASGVRHFGRQSVPALELDRCVIMCTGWQTAMCGDQCCPPDIIE